MRSTAQFPYKKKSQDAEELAVEDLRPSSMRMPMSSTQLHHFVTVTLLRNEKVDFDGKPGFPQWKTEKARHLD
jgi:hypothetical protein